jgi:hypothetical protein
MVTLIRSLDEMYSTFLVFPLVIMDLRTQTTSVFKYQKTLRLRGFGSISNLDTAILQQAPKLSTLDIACHPIPLSRAYDVVETLRQHCPLLENLRIKSIPF